jgi:hypothetical protein
VVEAVETDPSPTPGSVALPLFAPPWRTTNGFTTFILGKIFPKFGFPDLGILLYKISSKLFVNNYFRSIHELKLITS